MKDRWIHLQQIKLKQRGKVKYFKSELATCLGKGEERPGLLHPRRTDWFGFLWPSLTPSMCGVLMVTPHSDEWLIFSQIPLHLCYASIWILSKPNGDVYACVFWLTLPMENVKNVNVLHVTGKPFVCIPRQKMSDRDLTEARACHLGSSRSPLRLLVDTGGDTI